MAEAERQPTKVDQEGRGSPDDSRQAGGGEARGGAEEMHGANGGGRAEMLDNTSRADRSRGLLITRGGDATKKSGRNVGGSRFPDGTGEKCKDSRVRTREGTGTTDHKSIKQRSAPGSGMG